MSISCFELLHELRQQKRKCAVVSAGVGLRKRNQVGEGLNLLRIGGQRLIEEQAWPLNQPLDLFAAKRHDPRGRTDLPQGLHDLKVIVVFRPQGVAQACGALPPPLQRPETAVEIPAFRACRMQRLLGHAAWSSAADCSVHVRQRRSDLMSLPPRRQLNRPQIEHPGAQNTPFYDVIRKSEVTVPIGDHYNASKMCA